MDVIRLGCTGLIGCGRGESKGVRCSTCLVAWRLVLTVTVFTAKSNITRSGNKLRSRETLSAQSGYTSILSSRTPLDSSKPVKRSLTSRLAKGEYWTAEGRHPARLNGLVAATCFAQQDPGLERGRDKRKAPRFFWWSFLRRAGRFEPWTTRYRTKRKKQEAPLGRRLGSHLNIQHYRK